MSVLSNILSIVAIILTLGQLIYLIIEHFLKKWAINPTIEINIENPPPYKDVQEDTLILIKNIGTSIAYKPKLKIWISYALYDIIIELGGMISIEETIEKKIWLPENRYKSATGHMVFTVSVKTSKRGKERLEFEKRITIEPKKKLEFKSFSEN